VVTGQLILKLAILAGTDFLRCGELEAIEFANGALKRKCLQDGSNAVCISRQKA
jgi:hypothetical protein